MFEHFASCEANNFVPYLKPYKKHFFYLRSIYLKKNKKIVLGGTKFRSNWWKSDFCQTIKKKASQCLFAVSL